MSYKSAIKILLLIFVFSSFGALIIQEVRHRSRGAAAATSEAAEPPAADASQGPKREADGGKAGSKVVAYYFHVTVRCPTCRKIEALSEEALKRGFADALKDGSLEWRPVNVQHLENRHFIQDYQLFTKSLVIARMKDGKQVEWKNLEKVWELVWNSDAFLKYVQNEVRAYLEKE